MQASPVIWNPNPQQLLKSTYADIWFSVTNLEQCVGFPYYPKH